MIDGKNEPREENVAGNQPEEPTAIERREALKKLGKYAAYTSPVVIAVLTSEKGYAAPAPAPPPSPPAPH